VAAATQNQALSALLFLYREAFAQRLPWLERLDRAKRPAWTLTRWPASIRARRTSGPKP
jgi:hypothetical protein